MAESLLKGEKTMSDEQPGRIPAIERAVEQLRSLNLLSDLFVSVVLEDKEACQYVLRKLTGIGDLMVTNVKAQYRLQNLTSKDSILDIFAEDSEKKLYNIEIQRKDTIDHARRTRYYGSMIDKSSLDKGAGYDELADVYIIYISETDLWKAGYTMYPVEKTFKNTDIPYDDGFHVIYVNAAVDDGSEVAKMMQYFKSADPYDMSQGDLSKRVHFIKREKGGYDIMCEVAEKIYEQGIEQGLEQGEEQSKREVARNLHAMGMKDIDIARAVNVSLSKVHEWLELA